MKRYLVCFVVQMCFCYTSVYSQTMSSRLPVEKTVRIAEHHSLIPFSRLLFKAGPYLGVAVGTTDSSVNCITVDTASLETRDHVMLSMRPKPVLEGLEDVVSVTSHGRSLLVLLKNGTLFKGDIGPLPLVGNQILCQRIASGVFGFHLNNSEDLTAVSYVVKLGDNLPTKRRQLNLAHLESHSEQDVPFPTLNGQILSALSSTRYVATDSRRVIVIDPINYDVYSRTLSLDSTAVFHRIGSGRLIEYTAHFYARFDTLRGTIPSNEMLSTLDREITLDGQRVVSCFLADERLFVCKTPFEANKKQLNERLWDVWQVTDSSLVLLDENLADALVSENLVSSASNSLFGEGFSPILIGQSLFHISPVDIDDDIVHRRTISESFQNLRKTLYGGDLVKYFLIKRRFSR